MHYLESPFLSPPLSPFPLLLRAPDYQGGVYLHRNTGGSGSLSFAARVTLVASGSHLSYVSMGRIDAGTVPDLAVAVRALLPA